MLIYPITVVVLININQKGNKMRLKHLADQIQEASVKKNIPGVTKLQIEMKEYCGLSPERVRKVWYGEDTAKIIDYISTVKFLECDFNLPI